MEKLEAEIKKNYDIKQSSDKGIGLKTKQKQDKFHKR